MRKSRGNQISFLLPPPGPTLHCGQYGMNHQSVYTSSMNIIQQNCQVILNARMIYRFFFILPVLCNNIASGAKNMGYSIEFTNKPNCTYEWTHLHLPQ